jgi:hypothetical protein
MFGQAGEADGGCCSGMSVPLVPAPLVIFGCIFGFLLGIVIGSMASRKRAMMMGAGHHGKHSGHRHHHHGHGEPACRDPQCEWPVQMMAADQESAQE